MDPDLVTPTALSSSDTAPTTSQPTDSLTFPAEPATTAEATAGRRRGGRGARSTTQRATPASSAEPEADAPAAHTIAEVEVAATPSRSRRGRSRAVVPPPQSEPESGALALPTRIPSLPVVPAIEVGAVSPEHSAGEAPRRGRREPGTQGPMNRGAAPTSDEEATHPVIDPALTARTPVSTAPPFIASPFMPYERAQGGAAPIAESDGSDGSVVEAVSGSDDSAAPGRRRRRRGRGGRSSASDASSFASSSDADEGPEASDFIGDESGIPLEGTLVTTVDAEPTSTVPVVLSSAILRRFDHRSWRDRPSRPASTPAAPFRPVTGAPAIPVASAPTSVAEEPRSIENGVRRLDERRPPARIAPAAPPQAAVPQALPPLATESAAMVPSMTPPPVVMPTPSFPPSAPAARSGGSAPGERTSLAPFTPSMAPTSQGGLVGERLESLLQNQTTLIGQQQQMLESLLTTMAALQGAIERLMTGGIAAGMPRTGVFVDAPNIVYAAENARVAIDYGRMLDFVCRGREMVHAIVYAPVTEESAHRPELQRFVAPFLNKGYKLVTKPLKRFPDGTAKGNFDIELAIDIVTMAERLDVVVLISGDSDFSRLIELVQSRGVRVEVVAFSANVSWELVQMADVFIDVGQYLPEFRPLA